MARNVIKTDRNQRAFYRGSGKREGFSKCNLNAFSIRHSGTSNAYHLIPHPLICAPKRKIIQFHILCFSLLLLCTPISLRFFFFLFFWSILFHSEPGYDIYERKSVPNWRKSESIDSKLKIEWKFCNWIWFRVVTKHTPYTWDNTKWQKKSTTKIIYGRCWYCNWISRFPLLLLFHFFISKLLADPFYTYSCTVHHIIYGQGHLFYFAIYFI